MARKPRRIAGKQIGSSAQPARERVSDAEPRWQSQGISGGREALVPSVSAERGGGDSSVEGASGLEDGGVGLLLSEGSLVLLAQTGCGRDGRAARQGASVTRRRGLRRVDKVQRRSCPALTGVGGSPQSGERSTLVTACAAGINPPHCSGSEMPLAAIRRHRTRCCCQCAHVGARGRRQGPKRWSKGESPTAESWTI